MQKGFAPIFILIAAIVLALSAGGLYFFQKQQVKNINSFEECARVYPVMESYPARCATPDGRSFTQELTEEEKKKLQPPSEAASWRTYTNQKIKFSFKYPLGYELKEVSTPNIELVDLIKGGVSEVTIEVKDAKGKSLDEILSSERGIVKTIFSKEIMLGGERAIQERVEAQAMGGTDEGEGVYVVKRGQLIRIIYSDEVKKDLEVILQTFKFIDASPSPTSKNQCGDGVCQEVVCLAIGCPKPETPQNCPQDCK